ncbi:MAG: DEAD/DEAH box helicase family protein [Erysipelotrichaceae bacterium]|nr:DEAD/DEAH box helicase family protein [Erysipelotrichaceae bacterium]
MERDFTVVDAIELVEKHKAILADLSSIEDVSAEMEKSVIDASNDMIEAKTKEVLNTVPVEELSKRIRGVRIKALRENGYTTIDKILAATFYRLSSIYGISENAAYAIKEAANDIASDTAATVKIKLSLDDKNTVSSRLIKALYIYKTTTDNRDECSELLDEYKPSVEKALRNITPATSRLKWLFSGKDKKERAIKSYQYLSDLLNNDYYDVYSYNTKEIKKKRRSTSTEGWRDFEDNPIPFFMTLETIAPKALGNDDTKYGLPEELALEIQDQCYFPNGLLCDLRNYQVWGVKYILHQEKVLLGDEMGLGKTIQAIATMVSLKNTGATHFLVVCPLSVLTNWSREVVKNSKLRVVEIHGKTKETALEHWITTGGVGITTYETTSIFNLNDDFKFSQLVVDEAHYIKNADARRTQGVAKIASHAERILYMTGTALENRVDEMVKLITDLQPSIGRSASHISHMATAPEFRNIVAPVYYRRKRVDVLNELPDLTEIQEWCRLSSEEKRVYEDAVLKKNYAASRRVSWSVDNPSNSSKANRLRELVEEAKDDGRKIIVFSFFLDTIAKAMSIFPEDCYGPINGSVPPRRRQEILDEFDDGPPGSVLVAQIQSGGTGLNIQSGSVVVICEPQLKPSTENQAISRAYRMGQTRDVLVYRLLCENTIDERITDILEEKQRIFDAFADKSVAGEESVQLDEKTLGDIIEEEIKRIKEERGMIDFEEKNDINEV